MVLLVKLEHHRKVNTWLYVRLRALLITLLVDLVFHSVYGKDAIKTTSSTPLVVNDTISNSYLHLKTCLCVLEFAIAAWLRAAIDYFAILSIRLMSESCSFQIRNHPAIHGSRMFGNDISFVRNLRKFRKINLRSLLCLLHEKQNKW